MNPDWERILPVIVSIGIIITIAILREYSKTFAAVATVMPVNIPLGMWIVTAGTDNPRQGLHEFTGAVLINILPTVVFMLIAWYLSRTGWGLLPIILLGYSGWAVTLGIVFGIRAWLL
jgi:hypothetical protein